MASFDAGTRDTIKDAICHLAEHPLDGKPLKEKFQKDTVWSYRVWPYRILYRNTGVEWLDILSIEHRKGPGSRQFRRRGSRNAQWRH